MREKKIPQTDRILISHSRINRIKISIDLERDLLASGFNVSNSTVCCKLLKLVRRKIKEKTIIY